MFAVDPFRSLPVIWQHRMLCALVRHCILCSLNTSANTSANTSDTHELARLLSLIKSARKKHDAL